MSKKYIDAEKFKMHIESDSIVNRMNGTMFNFRQGYLSGVKELTAELEKFPAADVLNYDDLYSAIEHLYKSSSGKEHKAYSKVLDVITEMGITNDKSHDEYTETPIPKDHRPLRM